MKSIIVVVADRTAARIFAAESTSSPLVEIETMASPAGRLHERQMTSDLPGKSQGSGGSAGHAYENETDPKSHEMTEFAMQVAGYLDDARNANKISGLLLVAAPGFLGELRTHLSAQTSKLVVFELDKNLTRHSVEDIRQHLPKRLTH
ncbi:MAG: host attachment protein [Gammaproteobacteria bacterium]|nr:host attachment protein [Gammaproteobacteria bacterium]